MTAPSPSFEHRMERVEELIAQIEQSRDPTTQLAAREVVGLLLDLHRAGLARMLELVRDAGTEPHLMRRWLEDDLVNSLFVLHDLHPDDLESRVRLALDNVRPSLHSHGGDVELLAIADGAVRLRMTGSCNGCPSSSATVKATIEEALCAVAPDVTILEVDGVVPPRSALPLVELGLP